MQLLALYHLFLNVVHYHSTVNLATTYYATSIIFLLSKLRMYDEFRNVLRVHFCEHRLI